MNYVLLNDTFHNSDGFQISSENRSFLYGDGLFETMMIHKGVPLFLKEHFKRLNKGLKVLGMNNKDLQDYALFRKTIRQFLKKNEVRGHARMRLTAFRVEGGYYTPEKSEASYLIQGEIIDGEIYDFKEVKQIAIYDEVFKSRDALSNIKTCNGLPYIMASKHAKACGLQEVIMVNDRYRITEGYRSNIFIVKNKALYTPSLRSGCIEGVMRRQIIRLAKSLNIPCYQKNLKIEDALGADEIFYTNVIQGIMVNKKMTVNSIVEKLHAKLLSSLNG